MKRIIVVAIGIIIFILLLIGITFLESLKTKRAVTETTTPSPVTSSSSYKKIYKPNEAQKILENAINKPTLPPNDLAIRNSIVATLPQPVTTIFKTDLVEVRYVKGPNDFEGKITSVRVNEAKNQVITFFRDKGLSNEGICNLPLVFYPSLEIKTQFEQEGKTFTFLPDFCL